MNRFENKFSRPTVKQIDREIARLEINRKIRKAIYGIFIKFIVIAACTIVFSNLFIDVMTVNRKSMNPILQESDIIVALRVAKIKPGDIVAFYYNNDILLKRVIAEAGDLVNIDGQGIVYINDVAIVEPYVTEASLSPIDINLPFQVPDSCFFLMGDNREVSGDSRLREIGAIDAEMILGKVILRIWPLSRLTFFGQN